MKKYINESIIRQMVDKTLRKVLKEEFFGNEYNAFEVSKKNKDKNNDDGRLSDMNTEGNEDTKTRDSIESFFKQPGVNNAPYAYKLYNVEAEEGKDTNDMKNARKKFSDCVNHATNQNGYPYSFSSSELTRLKGMISGNQLNEDRLNQIIREAIENVTSNNDFEATAKQLLEAFKDVVGGQELKEILFNYFSDIIFFDDNDEEYKWEWKYNKKGMLNLLYNIVNYDLIDIFSNPGTINVENSNHPEIAKLLIPYCTPEMIKRIENIFR